MSTAARTPVFLLGAGASRDANLPLVGELTVRLIEEFRKHGTSIANVMELVSRTNVEAHDNYEVLFEWIHEQFYSPTIPTSIRDALGHVVRLAPTCVASTLNGWPRGDASYLTNLARISGIEHTQVFSLNYDTLIEDECERMGIPWTTGFDAGEDWNPLLLERNRAGIALFKLHGSLSWLEIPARNGNSGAVKELRDRRPARPILKLGPVKGERRDEPRDAIFDHTREHFEHAIAAAGTCVVIGYGFGRSDRYVTDALAGAVRNGTRLIEVNPTPCAPPSIRSSRRYFSIELRARASLAPGGPLERLLRES